MRYWLLKTEPAQWSWSQQSKTGQSRWDGVRNPQALRHMRSMRPSDLCFFYHTGTERRIVGIVEIVKPFYPDPEDPSRRRGQVDVRAVMPLLDPVSLEAIKAELKLSHLALVRQPRLSVVPIDPPAWRLICRMGRVSC
jgi:predicted RNA-binding protein with PUA-like domain